MRVATIILGMAMIGAFPGQAVAGEDDMPPADFTPPADAITVEPGLAYKVLKPGPATVPGPAAAPGPVGELFVRHYTDAWARDKGRVENAADGLSSDQPASLRRRLPAMAEILEATRPGAKYRWWLSAVLIPEGTRVLEKRDHILDVAVVDRVAPLAPPPDVAAIPADALVTPSGVALKVLGPGDGDARPGPDAMIEVHYTGWTTDGKMFDSTRLRERRARFPLNKLITGWQIALPLMREGATARLWIPGDLAYDQRADRPFAPKGMLVFDVELLGFTRPAGKAKTEVGAALDALHAAERAGDLEHFLAAFADDGIFLGTAAEEAWSKEELRRDLGKRFATRGGWTFEIRDRTIGVSDEGNTAWFREIAHYVESDYVLRPTGTMVKRDGKWQIVQLHMGIPIPNELHPALLQSLHARDAGPEAEKLAVAETLDALHAAAAKADGARYFALFDPDAVFIGTDAGETWTLDIFKAYAAPIFAQGRGWTYIPGVRHIYFAPGGATAWFDEILASEKYGTSRGTGVLRRTNDGWKISQYHLTFPIPNDLATDITERIKAFEAGQSGPE